MIEYTQEDLKVLLSMAVEDSPVKEILIEHDCDPGEFKKFMSMFPKEYDFVYNLGYLDLPMSINDQKYQGFLQFRLAVRK
jgi:hypothetical protein